MLHQRTLALLPLVAVLATAAAANACPNAVFLGPPGQSPRTPVQRISGAERLLDRAEHGAAMKAVVTTFPKIRATEASASPLEARALRVFALAIVRTSGGRSERDLGIDGGGREEARWMPAANLAWAVQSLREIDAKRPNDPAVQADLGEALSKLPASQDEAMNLLGTLAEKDLMGSPFAYAALAKLRSDRGDSAGAEAAVKRCEEMSKSPGVCTPAKPVR